MRTRSTAEDLAVELGARGVASAALSGDVVQKEREKLVARLREGTLDVLVATDVAARGLDVERIGIVVNFDVPRETDTYVHRVGRTGRAGRSGEALTFVTPKERPRLRRIERQTGSRMEQVELPTLAEVSRLRAERTIDRAIARHAKGRLSVYRDVLRSFEAAQAEAAEPLPQDELLVSLLALAVRDPGPVAGEEPERLTVDVSPERGEGRRQRDRGPHQRKPLDNAVRYRVEVGHRDRVKPGAIVGALTHEGGLRGSDLGHIDIYPTFSLVEIGVPLTAEARERIFAARVSGRALRITEDRGPGGRADGEGRSHRRKNTHFKDDARSNGRDAHRFDREGRREGRHPRSEGRPRR